MRLVSQAELAFIGGQIMPQNLREGMVNFDHHQISDTIRLAQYSYHCNHFVTEQSGWRPLASDAKDLLMIQRRKPPVHDQFGGGFQENRIAPLLPGLPEHSW